MAGMERQLTINTISPVPARMGKERAIATCAAITQGKQTSGSGISGTSPSMRACATTGHDENLPALTALTVALPWLPDAWRMPQWGSAIGHAWVSAHTICVWLKLRELDELRDSIGRPPDRLFRSERQGICP